MTKKTELKRTSNYVFLKAYAKALREGWTREKLAEHLGIKPDSVYSRVKNIKYTQDKELSPLRSENDPSKEELDSLMEACCNGGTHINQQDEEAPSNTATEEEVAAALEYLE